MLITFCFLKAAIMDIMYMSFCVNWDFLKHKYLKIELLGQSYFWWCQNALCNSCINLYSHLHESACFRILSSTQHGIRLLYLWWFDKQKLISQNTLKNLWRYSNIIKFTYLMWTIPWFLIYSLDCAIIATNSKTF